MANARRTQSGKYRVRRYKDGVLKSFTAETKAEAERLAAEWAANKIKEDPTPTLYKALNNYVKSKEPVLSPSTAREYYKYIDCYYDQIGDIKIQDLDSLIIQNFVSNLALNRSPKTVRNVYSFTLSAIHMIDPTIMFKVTLPSKVKVTRTVPTDEQLQTLLDNADDELKNMIYLGAFGLRRGEACALTYEDLFPDMGFIQINKDMVQNKDKEWIVKPMPKTSSSFRVVRMPKDLILSFGTGEGRIYTRTPNALTRSFERLRDRLQIHISYHSLRRYLASILHALGFPDKYIQQMGGWSSPYVMQQCYENVLEDKNVEYTKKMNDYYSEKFLKNKASS